MAQALMSIATAFVLFFLIIFNLFWCYSLLSIFVARNRNFHEQNITKRVLVHVFIIAIFTMTIANVYVNTFY